MIHEIMQSSNLVCNRLRQSRWVKSVLVASLSLFAVLGYSPFGSVVYASQSNVVQEVNAYLNSYVKLGWFSGSVLIAQGNKILLDKSYGMADYKHHVPITSDTEFQIGSMTKQFTAMAILQLQQKGLLNVNDKLGKYLPQYPRWKDITIKELLTHTSGIPDYINDGFVPSSFFDKLHPLPKVISLFANKPLDFPPGTEYEYSDSNYAVLGYLVQKLSGMSYADYLEQNIFKPLGMTHTGYLTSSHIPDMAVGYAYTGVDGKNGKEVPRMYVYGDGGLYSTVDDLYRWDRALYTTRLASRKSLSEMFSAEEPIGGSTSYGFGWMIDGSGTDEIEFHNGRVWGFESFIVRYPAKKISIIVLSNSDTIPVNTDLDDLVSIVIDHSSPVFPVLNNKGISLKPSQVSRYVGRYEYEIPSLSPSAMPEFMNVTAIKNQLYVGNVPIYPVSYSNSNSIFVSKLIDETFLFHTNSAGVVTNVTLLDDGATTYLNRAK